jgi:aquaporin related protein
MLAKEKHKATFIAPVGIGLALFVAELVGVFYTGGSLNPARSFGPCVVTGIFDKEHWIYCKLPLIFLNRVLITLQWNMVLITRYRGGTRSRLHCRRPLLQVHQDTRI